MSAPVSTHGPRAGLWGQVRHLLSPQRPWVYLVYLSFFFFQWFFRPPLGYELQASLIGLVVFLVLYIAGAWRRDVWALPFIAGIAIDAFVLAHWNYAAGVFWIFAASMAGRLQPARLAVGTFAALLVTLLAVSLSTGLPLYFAVPVALVGGLTAVSVFYGMRLAERTEDLQQSREQGRALAAQAERERIARDLHDLLGHTLSVIAIKADLANRLVAADPDRARGEIADIARISRDGLTQVRDAVSGMRMSLLAQEVAQARMALEAADIVLETRIDTGGDLASDIESAAALALREAVTNVIRHSGAGRCRIRIGREDGELHLSIADDGRGGPVRKGNGLSGMQSRLQACGGELATGAADLGGVQVDIVLPLGDKPSGGADNEAESMRGNGS